MNPILSNPYMYILQADPDKYIRRPASVIVALIKALEGIVTFLWCFRGLDRLWHAIRGHAFTGPIEALTTLLPGTLTRLVFPSGIPAGRMLLSFAAALCVLHVLVCMMAEAVAAVLLFFDTRKKGAKWFKTTRRRILVSCVLFTACLVLSFLGQLAVTLVSGFPPKLSELYPLLAQLAVILLLLLRIRYHRDAYAVMKAVEYEIRLGFKETGLGELRLGWTALLLGALCLAAALMILLTGRRHALAFILLAVKYFAVWRSWRFFKRCHR